MDKILKLIKSRDNLAQLYEYSTTDKVITGVSIEGLNKQAVGSTPSESRQELLNVLEERLKVIAFMIKELREADQQTNFITEVRLGDTNENIVYC